MKSSNQIELTAGLFLLLAIGALVFLALQATDRGTAHGESYELVAHFTNIGSLKERAQVRMSGVAIGSVDEIALDEETLEARVVMRIRSDYDDLPEDTSASILTSGILGDQYIGLEPGGSPEPLRDGDRILLTNSAVVLEQLIGRYLFNSEEDNGEQ